MVAWIVSTRSTVSQNKTINEKQPSVRVEDAWLFSCFFKSARKIQPSVTGKTSILKFARKMQPAVTGKTSIFEICP
ncbi:hypothetical protein HMPREF0542_11252 [Ligilactobacillus ruminis ATCC 25644]|uniref:Uncharacterized protein n=1 Tax=Ligilactobacillus ruminis ATCC 25644 TaxID=525362 RepID=E7FQQ7_9LACO|nr:hypothetical protein HMPREF0542_11252 [Ligilactobacillus ruminis ATCC 25644]